MTRDEALDILKTPPLTEEEGMELFREVAKKLGLTEEELMAYHDMPRCTEKFKSQEKLFNIGIRIYEMLGIEKRIRR